MSHDTCINCQRDFSEHIERRVYTMGANDVTREYVTVYQCPYRLNHFQRGIIHLMHGSGG